MLDDYQDGTAQTDKISTSQSSDLYIIPAFIVPNIRENTIQMALHDDVLSHENVALSKSVGITSSALTRLLEDIMIMNRVTRIIIELQCLELDCLLLQSFTILFYELSIKFTINQKEVSLKNISN